jgi:hypothetical protein
MYCLDANVLLTAWYVTYPPRIFAPLWELLAANHQQMLLIRPVFDEIEPISSSDRRLDPVTRSTKYPLRSWIENTGFTIAEIDEEVSNLSLRLEYSYEVAAESKGASQVDITLIAYAKRNQGTVVTLEGYQNQRPGERKNYKIPLICVEEGVPWLNFVQMLDEIGVNM